MEVTDQDRREVAASNGSGRLVRRMPTGPPSPRSPTGDGTRAATTQRHARTKRPVAIVHYGTPLVASPTDRPTLRVGGTALAIPPPGPGANPAVPADRTRRHAEHLLPTSEATVTLRDGPWCLWYTMISSDKHAAGPPVFPVDGPFAVCVFAVESPQRDHGEPGDRRGNEQQHCAEPDHQPADRGQGQPADRGARASRSRCGSSLDSAGFPVGR